LFDKFSQYQQHIWLMAAQHFDKAQWKAKTGSGNVNFWLFWEPKKFRFDN